MSDQHKEHFLSPEQAHHQHLHESYTNEQRDHVIQYLSKPSPRSRTFSE
jgi:hypothetical protein